MNPMQPMDEAQAAEILQAWCAESDVPIEMGARRGEWVVTLPGEAKLRTVVSVVITPRAMKCSAFVIRRPDEDHLEFTRWLLHKNLKLPGVAFAIDHLGDVYLQGRLALAAVSEQTLDELFGAILSTADSSFNELLAIGFLSSMRKEWQWRTDRGESTANLEAFRHLLEPSTDSSAQQ